MRLSAIAETKEVKNAWKAERCLQHLDGILASDEVPALLVLAQTYALLAVVDAVVEQTDTLKRMSNRL